MSIKENVLFGNAGVAGGGGGAASEKGVDGFQMQPQAAQTNLGRNFLKTAESFFFGRTDFGPAKYVISSDEHDEKNKWPIKDEIRIVGKLGNAEQNVGCKHCPRKRLKISGKVPNKLSRKVPTNLRNNLTRFFSAENSSLPLTNLCLPKNFL
jgi:hypothetical protein